MGVEDGGVTSASARVDTRPVAAWLRKLGPSRTLSERTCEHCVSPSLKATAATGLVPSQVADGHPTLPQMAVRRSSELGGSIDKVLAKRANGD